MTNLRKFLTHSFSSGGEVGEDYIEFQKRFLGYIKKEAKNRNWEMASYSKGHYECSCFIKNPENDKYVYISISDVRFFKNQWYERILFRTAKGPKDYTGGFNQYSTLPELMDNISTLL